MGCMPMVCLVDLVVESTHQNLGPGLEKHFMALISVVPKHLVLSMR